MERVPVELRAFGLDLSHRQDVLYLILAALIFSVSITTGTWGLGNSRIVMFHEWLFILSFVLLKPSGVKLAEQLRKHWFVIAALLVWAISISISLWFSPMGLRHITIAQFRYAETLTHVAFFLALYLSFLGRRVPYLLLVRMLVYSNALVVVHAFLLWHFSSEEGIQSQRMWFFHFPLAGHARHAGYNMLVSSILALAYLCAWRNGLLSMVSRVLAAFLVISCLVWLGGRGALLSMFLALMIIFMIGGGGKVSRNRLLAMSLVIMCGVFAAERASQFSFNGLSGSITRSVGADSLNALSSSRLAIWEDSLSKLEGHWFLGLGSQAYIFLPDKIARQTSMPHNFVVQFLLEWGGVGAAIFIALLGWLYVAGISGLYRVTAMSGGRSWEYCLSGVAAVTIALGLHGLTDGTFYHGKPSFYFALCAAIWMAGLVTHYGETDKNCQC